MNLNCCQLGKYSLVERLGSGGMAEVFKGFQPNIERFVAIKVMHKHLAAQDQFVERFRSEAKGVAQLRHHNIVRIIDFDVQDDLYYMVLDYIEGQTLRTCLKKHGLLEPCQALYIVAQLADALVYAHRRGIIHRDIKPGNIMFMDDSFCSPVLTDFGLVRILNDEGMTMTGAMIGTPAYMSPEALRGEKVDERADIYSLGVVLYEMVVGRTPYMAESPYGMILKQLHEPLPPPRSLNPELPKVVEDLILKAMAKELPERFQSAEEFRQALQEAFAYLNDGQKLSLSLSMRLTPTFPLPKQRQVKAKYSSMSRFASLGAAFGGSLIVALLMAQLFLGAGHRSGKVQNKSVMAKATVERHVSPDLEDGEGMALADLTATALPAAEAVEVERLTSDVLPPTATMVSIADGDGDMMPIDVLYLRRTVLPPERHEEVAPTIPAQVVPATATEVHEDVAALIATEVPLPVTSTATQLSDVALSALPTQTASQVAVVMPTEVLRAPSVPATTIPTLVPATPIPTEKSQEAMAILPTEASLDAAMAIPTEAPAATATPIPQPTQPPAATATPIPQPTEAPAATATPIPQPTEPPAATATPIPQPTEPPAATATPIPQPTEPPAATATPIPQPTEAPRATATPIPQPTEAPQPTERPTVPTETGENSEPVEDNEEQAPPDDDNKGENGDDKGEQSDNKGENGDDKGEQSDNKGENRDDKGGNSGNNAQNEQKEEVQGQDEQQQNDEEQGDEDKGDEDKRGKGG